MPDTQPRTVPELFLDRVGRSPDLEAFRHPVDGGWRSLTWAETEARVRAIACGLRALGVAPEQVCAILSSTRIEWVLADYGILCAAAATSTIYPSTLAEECAFILSDAGAVVAFAEDAGQVAKLSARRRELPALRHVITFDGTSTPDGWALPLADLEARGRAFDAEHPGAFEEHVAAVRPDALATLLYTSGTTGRPKGVELTHGGWVSQSRAVQESGILSHPDPLQFFWLPLAHSFGKMIGTAQLRIGFPTAVDGRVDRIVENLGQVRPTFVCAVPRIFEKVHAKILAGGHSLEYGLQFGMLRHLQPESTLEQLQQMSTAGHSPPFHRPIGVMDREFIVTQPEAASGRRPGDEKVAQKKRTRRGVIVIKQC